jgi:hypothetical protein
MPCQNAMESSPATLKISEKVRKYHFFPRKSMLVSLKNSIRTQVSGLQSFKVSKSKQSWPVILETLKP